MPMINGVCMCSVAVKLVDEKSVIFVGISYAVFPALTLWSIGGYYIVGDTFLVKLTSAEAVF